MNTDSHVEIEKIEAGTAFVLLLGIFLIWLLILQDRWALVYLTGVWLLQYVLALGVQYDAQKQNIEDPRMWWMSIALLPIVGIIFVFRYLSVRSTQPKQTEPSETAGKLTHRKLWILTVVMSAGGVLLGLRVQWSFETIPYTYPLNFLVAGILGWVFLGIIPALFVRRWILRTREVV